MIVHDAGGTPLRLGEALARGGEAIVYPVEGRDDEVAKLYVPAPRRGYARKLDWMRAHPPRLSPGRARHLLVAWPTELLYNRGGRLVGYLMPRVRDAVPLLEVYSPRLRARVLPLFDSRYRYRAAQHLAYLIDALHRHGYVVGDLNESNVLVTPAARVSLIDVDSFQVVSEDGGRRRLHPCPVGKAEYAAPELQGQALGGTRRGVEQDYFALAVLIFKLLMEGRHPFQGRFLGAGEPPPLEQKIARGWFPHVARPVGPVAPPLNTPPLETLAPAVAAAFRRCFADGHRDPAARPAPREWVRLLREAEGALVPCARGHYFVAHNPRCPRCGAARAWLPPWLQTLLAAGSGAVRGALMLLWGLLLGTARALVARRPRLSSARGVAARLRPGRPSLPHVRRPRLAPRGLGRGRLRRRLRHTLRRGAIGLATLVVASLLLLSIPRISVTTRSVTLPGSAAPATPLRARVQNVAPDRLNLRAAPGLESAVITTLAEGSEVELLERDPGGAWARVRVGAIEGWVASDFLLPVGAR